MTNYQAQLEAYLSHYQPQLKAELQHTQQLQNYLAEQSEAMAAMETKLINQLQEVTPGLSRLQAELEAQRTVLEHFLTP
ncbi:MAG: hypothetical protein AAF702_05170 [Chloroflexota bacterium]